MKSNQRKFAGAFAIAVLLAFAGVAHAQDSDTTSTETGQSPMMNQGQTGGYCQPGCVVGPTSGQGAMMMPGMMMNPGMMVQPMMMPGMMYQMPMMGGAMMMDPRMMGQGMMGQSVMGQGMMPMMGGGMMMDPHMMGQGMMGQGTMNQMPMMGGGMMGQGQTPMMGAVKAEPLTPDGVRLHLERHLAMTGLPNLMLGSVEAQDDDTFVAEIVTKDGTLVQRLSIDRLTGAMTPLE